MARFAGALLVGLVQLAPFDKLSTGGFMTTTNSIVPPPELADKWVNQSPYINPEGYIATKAAQWGYQQAIEELEAFLRKGNDAN